jgi:patatin-like phospholipase/acyl hydrolase
MVTSLIIDRRMFVADVEKKLVDMKKRLQELESSDAYEDDASFKRQFDDVREHVMNMDRNLGRVRAASEDDWHSIRGTVENMWAVAQDMFDNFVNKSEE